MMTIAILELESAGVSSKRFKVRPGQSVLIGSSNSSDIRLPSPDRVASRHCEVTYTSGTLAVKNLTDGRGQVRVNGDTVDRQNLFDGDQLEIGDNRLRVVLQADRHVDSGAGLAVAGAVAAAAVQPGLEGQAESNQQSRVSQPADTTSPNASGAPAESSADSQASEETEEELELPQLEICENGLRVGLFDSVDATLLPLVAGEAAWEQAQLVNHLASGLPQPAPESTNLLAELPPDLAEANDLYLVPREDPKVFAGLFEKYADQNASTLVLNKPGGGISEDDMKFLAAWFLTPGHLKFNLLNGTNLLLEKVFSLVDAIVVRDLEKGCDLILVFDGTVNDWESLVTWLQEVDQ